ncbi:UvrD-helicase domain-containing protein [Desulfonatronum thioautotrophicum]|uniref:UvrD-helicase domain-containing protein n=1 Tax=Desulfonatronum thioautotrophicum TaxID=617001 RepID=UPI0005EBC03F|nr:UvrD-helicase domain-containing protein [Desulfonatronum thioautotrophicum]
MTTDTSIPLPEAFPHVLVVQASAGAGKTYSLGLRFLQLLARSGRPSVAGLSRILALTFTVAAAQEMKSRIVTFLKEIALETPSGCLLRAQSGLTPQAAGEWLEQILGQYQRFQVKTIDSLHFQLVQTLARRLDLWPELEAGFNSQAWGSVVLEGLLARTDWEQAVVLSSDVSTSQGEPMDRDPELTQSLSALWEDIFKVYLHQETRTGLRFLPWLEEQVTGVVRDLNQIYEPLTVTSLDDLRRARAAFQSACQELAATLDRVGLSGHVSRFKPAKLEALLNDPFGNLESAFFAKTTPEDLFNKAAWTNSGVPPAWDAYQDVRRSRNAFLLTRARLSVAPLAKLHHVVNQELDRLGRTQGLLPGGWWTRLLRMHLSQGDLLQDAALILGVHWQHLLIDEFQDTSREQWDVLRELALEALAEGGSLFCVGDVKQAIYRWRGGDWRLFFEPLDPRVLPNVAPENRLRTVLPFNRRSCRDVVAWNNACFATLEQPQASQGLAQTMITAPDKNEPRTLLAEIAALLYAEANQTPWRECVGAVQTVTIPTDDLDDGTEAYTDRALHHLVNRIVSLREEAVDLGRIAVLVRTNKEARECAARLLAADIPTITEQSLVISAHPGVRGLLALLTWLDNPGDDAALFALCRNPVLFREAPEHLPDMDALLQHSESQPPIQTPDHTQTQLPNQSEGRARRPLYLRLQEAYPAFWARHLHPFWERAGLAGAYELLLTAVAHFRLRELPLGQWAWVEKLLETAFQAESQGQATLSAFLAFWEENAGSCVVGLPEGLPAVRVMTVHKAKGLEFPHVFLPLLDYGEKNRPAHLLLSDNNGSPGLVSTTKPRAEEVARIMDQEQVHSMAEELNLLYVALTRAKEDLHIFLPAGKTSRGSRAADWLRNLMADQTTPSQ